MDWASSEGNEFPIPERILSRGLVEMWTRAMHHQVNDWPLGLLQIPMVYEIKTR